jgi:hypothetical protein
LCAADACTIPPPPSPTHALRCAAIDNDDGSNGFATTRNVFYYAALNAAYGGSSLKSDFGGHSNVHSANYDIGFTGGFSICPQLEGFSDEYTNNTLYQIKDGNYGNGQTCSGNGTTIVGDNTVWTPTGAVTECGMTLAQWQAQGHDAGTTAAAWPSDQTVLNGVIALLGLSA